MFKSIKVTEDVYFFLKARAIEEKKSLSDVIRDMNSTSIGNQSLEDRLKTVESELKELKKLFFETASSKEPIAKKERPSRDLNPSRSLDRAP